MRYIWLGLSLALGLLATFGGANSIFANFEIVAAPVQSVFLVIAFLWVYAEINRLSNRSSESQLDAIDMVVSGVFIWALIRLQGGLEIHRDLDQWRWHFPLMIHFSLFFFPIALFAIKGARPWHCALLLIPWIAQFGQLFIVDHNPEHWKWIYASPLYITFLIWAVISIAASLRVYLIRSQETEYAKAQAQALRAQALRSQVTQTQPTSKVSNLNIDSRRTVQSIKSTKVDESLIEYRDIMEKVAGLLLRLFRPTGIHAFVSTDKGNTYQLVCWAELEGAQTKENAVIYKDSGVIGEYIQSECLIIELENYASKGKVLIPEFFENADTVSSLMFSQVKDPNTQEALGLIVMERVHHNGNFDDSDLRQLLDISSMATQLILSLRRRLQLAEDERQSKALYDCSKSMLNKLKVSDVLEDLYRSIQDAFATQRILLIKPDPITRMALIQRVIGQAIQEIPLKNETWTFERSENQIAFQSALIPLNGGELGAYARTMLEAKSVISPRKVGEFRLRKDLTDDLNYAMIGYLRIENNIIAIVGAERNRPFAHSDLVIFRNIMMLASSALEKAKSYQEREKQATIDGLTGIPNHRHFQDTLDKEIVRSIANKVPVTLLLMDIDFFKKFNDTYGHQVGDLVLKHVAKTLRNCIRKEVDMVARYGGEEFIVILPGQDALVARKSAERIRHSIEAMDVIDERNPDIGILKVTVSVGIASYSTDAETKADLIEHADEALYQCKGRGRNCVTIWRQKHESWRGEILANDQNPLPMAPAAGTGDTMTH